VEFCDSSGKVLGHFLPAEAYREMLLASANAQLSPQGLQRRRQEPRGRTLPEIWTDLGQA
jgi:hypothetical protein